MQAPIVIIGMGELGGVFARGFLRCGHPVYPITRQMNLIEESNKIPAPTLVLISVQENGLHSVLEQIPKHWQNKLGLIQNELLPKDWLTHNIEDPTVAVVWFEKKKSMELTSILYTPCYGPNASLISNALLSLGESAPILKNEEDLLYELLRKTVYILTVNTAGLVQNCSVGELWHKHQALAREIATEIILIQESLTGKQLPIEKLINGMAEGIKDCPHRYCLGRSAPARLKRWLTYAAQFNIATPKLLEISNNLQ
ncbi:MAG: hypothetical protein GQ529_04365 [Methyloprofundus sp.]|nr:hypothetical protein [Methyloprofundus sp.]